MACLETTFLIDLLRGKENVRLLKDKLDETESSLSITPVSIMELWIGASLKSSEQEKENILALEHDTYEYAVGMAENLRRASRNNPEEAFKNMNPY